MKNRIYSDIIALLTLLCLTKGIGSTLADENELRKIDPMILETLDIKNIDINASDFDPNLKSIAFAVKAKSSNLTKEQNAVCDRNLLGQINNLRSKSSRGLIDELYLLEGILFETCKDYTNAKSSYEKSLKLRRNNPLALYRVAAILIREQKQSEATQSLKEAEWNGFKDKYILNFLTGVIYASNNNQLEAINKYQETLRVKANFLPAAKLIYQSKVELRKNTKDSKLIKKLDLEIPTDLATIVRLDPKNQEFSLPYIRYLLTTGDSINSPAKLIEGEKLVDSMLKLEPRNYSEFALLKVQFLEKQNKSKAVAEYLNELEKNDKLTSILRIKKDQLDQEIGE